VEAKNLRKGTAMPQRAVTIIGAAGDHPALARRIANGFDNPLDLFPWFMVPEEAEGYLQYLAAG
jgi:hypothetical protein